MRCDQSSLSVANRSVSSDIKDKQPLMDARRSIERDMERFKACEKESKIKGINKVHNDPKEKAKEDAMDWINTTVDTITTKVRVGHAVSGLTSQGGAVEPAMRHGTNGNGGHAVHACIAR